MIERHLSGEFPAAAYQTPAEQLVPSGAGRSFTGSRLSLNSDPTNRGSKSPGH
ncbi:hypothetical protein M407DRAFT_246403 [Tulasnella calospora MUT 4182]|uniref:Uncharacterized protein n=1 Tax=Tulasnella calospora MUT 4182 TaxID=1051891 RepID=A0A0C3LB22_9AGAM|nr:hypothetical protein M407DRAFT_246403 [Tulasnella calospora MUT 4182]